MEMDLAQAVASVTAFVLSPLGAAVVGVILLAILAALAAFLLSPKKPKRDTVLLVGLCDSGKTTLFSLLRYGKAHPTESSIDENQGTFRLFGTTIPHKPLRVVDLPGHTSLRFKLRLALPRVHSVLILLDSSSFRSHVHTRACAELAYDVLADPEVVDGQARCLFVCNKQDLFSSWSAEKMRTCLEKEIDKLRSTRTASSLLSSTSSPSSTADDTPAYLGHDGEPFKFDHLAGEVEFVECAMVGQEPGHVAGVGGASEAEGDGEGGSGVERIKRWILAA